MQARKTRGDGDVPLIDDDAAHAGAWSPEEVQELTTIVRSMTSQQGGSTVGISWADVAARMGHKRNGQQCRNKWCDRVHRAITVRN